jgi:hypothetical protein
MLNQRPSSSPRPEDNSVTSPDLSTTYLGFRLANPLVVSASPLGHDLDNLKRMENAGAAGGQQRHSHRDGRAETAAGWR